MIGVDDHLTASLSQCLSRNIKHSAPLVCLYHASNPRLRSATGLAIPSPICNYLCRVDPPRPIPTSMCNVLLIPVILILRQGDTLPTTFPWRSSSRSVTFPKSHRKMRTRRVLRNRIDVSLPSQFRGQNTKHILPPLTCLRTATTFGLKSPAKNIKRTCLFF